MANTIEMALLKTDLGFTGPLPYEMEAFLQQKIEAARSKIAKHGIALDERDNDDLDLLVMYAAWLYRKRAGSDPMPPMLRLAINDHKVTQKPEVAVE